MPRGGQGKRYPEDFKQSAIELALSNDESISEIAKTWVSTIRLFMVGLFQDDVLVKL